MTRSGLHGLLVGSLFLGMVLVGAITALPLLVVPNVAVAPGVAAATVRPGTLDDSYVQSIAYDWLYHAYDWDALNYEARAVTAVRGVAPQLRASYVQFLKAQKDVIVAGKQTQEAVISIVEVKRQARSWQVGFTVKAAVWYGGFQNATRNVAGRLILSMHPDLSGGRGLLMVDDIDITDDASTPISTSTPEPNGSPTRK